MLKCDYLTVTAPRPWRIVGHEYLTVEKWGGAGGYKGTEVHLKGGGTWTIATKESGRHLVQLTGVAANERGEEMAQFYASEIERLRVDGTPGGASDEIVRCTRIDICLDVESCEPFDAIEAREKLKDAKWGHRQPKMICWRSDGDTLYIGAPGSPKRWRIYQKSDGLIRYEIQLRNSSRHRYAHAAMLEWVRGEGLSRVWDTEAGMVPLGVIPHGQNVGSWVGEVEGEERHPYDWLNRAVRPYLKKMNPRLSEMWLREMIEEVG